MLPSRSDSHTERNVYRLTTIAIAVSLYSKITRFVSAYLANYRIAHSPIINHGAVHRTGTKMSLHLSVASKSARKLLIYWLTWSWPLACQPSFIGRSHRTCFEQLFSARHSIGRSVGCMWCAACQGADRRSPRASIRIHRFSSALRKLAARARALPLKLVKYQICMQYRTANRIGILIRPP